MFIYVLPPPPRTALSRDGCPNRVTVKLSVDLTEIYTEQIIVLLSHDLHPWLHADR